MEFNKTKLVQAHPDAAFSSLEGLLGGVKLSKDQERYLVLKIRNYLLDSARRNKDYKKLVGFQEFHLVEIRWNLNLAGSEVPGRLICSEAIADRLLLLCWQVKDPELPSETQRNLMNMACLQGIERLTTIDWN